MGGAIQGHKNRNPTLRLHEAKAKLEEKGLHVSVNTIRHQRRNLRFPLKLSKKTHTFSCGIDCIPYSQNLPGTFVEYSEPSDLWEYAVLSRKR